MSVDLFQNRVRRADNVLPLELLHHIVKVSSATPGYDTNLNSWDEWLHRGSGEIRLRSLFGDLRLYILEHLQAAFCEHTLDLTDATVIYQEFYEGALINWHDDCRPDVTDQYASTIYLNDDWTTEDGGAFVFEADANTEQYVTPSFNTAVLLRPPVQHRVSPCTAGEKVRKTIQIFGGTPIGGSK